MRTRSDYDFQLQALGICIAARVPFLLWGLPGEGKTAVVESAADAGWLVETLIVSHHEPSDFAGLPVVAGDGSVTLAPPSWAQRLAAYDGPGLAFFDEWTTASPAVQAAALRPLTHGEVGSLQLPQTVAFGAAANPADVAVGGWELAAPTANRFCHLDWHLPLDVYTEGLVTGQWPSLSLFDCGAAYEAELRATRVLVAGYLRARQTQLSALPKDAAGRGRAFPTPRTWEYASRLLALARSVGASRDVARLLVFGCIGDATGHEFLAWTAAQDLPDPEELLADPASARFTGMRPDRVHVVLQSLLAAVAGAPSPERWTTAVQLCAVAAQSAGLDAAVPVVRALLRGGLRPVGAAMPPEIRTFAAPLALAGLLPAAS
ncbi:MAG TPA: AAA family ATPase [Frankiaceae bacterium]|nr:AAA family ATPase [Frankiaceae bacterium]